VEIDPQVLLVLIAIRLLGGKSLPVKAEALKGLKVPVKLASEQGLIAQDKTEVTTVGKTGKARKTKVEIWTLTAQGEEYWKRNSNPEVLAAIFAGQKARVLAELQDDRDALRRDLQTRIEGAFAGLEKKAAGGPVPAPVLHAAVVQPKQESDPPPAP